MTFCYDTAQFHYYGFGTIQEARHKTVEFPWKFHRDKTVEFPVEFPWKFHIIKTVEFTWKFHRIKTVEFPVEFPQDAVVICAGDATKR